MNALPKSVGCPVEFALVVLGGKWKTVLLAHLKEGPRRYGELRRLTPRLSDKMLSQRLDELQRLGLIERSAQDGVYRLAPAGDSLRPVLQSLYDWGVAKAPDFGVDVQSA
jgi:DNA-binding HxlR family transcriptional regulator